MSDERFLLPGLATDALTASNFFSSDFDFDEAAPFQGKLYDGDPSLMVVVGENASGKSLFFRVINAYAARYTPKVTGITISIRERTGGGSLEMGRMRQTFMFGDEAEQSTGATSVNVISNGFKNAYSGNHGQTLLMLDEPEMGLSDGYARALGEWIGQSTLGITEACHGVLIVTHNRALVRGLVKGFNAPPAFVYMGEQPMDLDSWLNNALDRKSVADLMNLRKVAQERRAATQRIINASKEA